MKYLRIAVLSLSLFVTLFRGQDAAAAVDTVVAINSVWKYLDDGTDPGPDWFNPSFGDSAWFSGPAELGYGDGDEATVVRGTNLLSERIITTYFRHEFNLANPPGLCVGPNARASRRRCDHLPERGGDIPQHHACRSGQLPYPGHNVRW